jgi:hypothetical protein
MTGCTKMRNGRRIWEEEYIMLTWNLLYEQASPYNYLLFVTMPSVA